MTWLMTDKDGTIRPFTQKEAEKIFGITLNEQKKQKNSTLNEQAYKQNTKSSVKEK